MDAKREPLSVKNTSIPKPSRLLQPGTMSSRKRPAQTCVEPDDKENGPVVKRVKVESPNKAPHPSSTAITKKSSTAKSSSVTAAAKSKGRGVGTTTAGTKKTTKTASTLNKVASKSKASTNSTLAAKKTTTSTKTVGKAAGTNAGGGKGGGGGKQKRSPWDLKGRLQDMEVLMADERNFSTNTIGDLQTQLVGLAQRLAEIEGVRQQQEGTIIAKQEENTAASSQIKSLESELASTKKEVNDNRVKYEHELEILRLSKSSLQRSVEQLDSDLKVSRMEVARMTADASAIQCQLDATKGELASTKKELNENTVKYEHELEMLRLSKSSLQRSVEQLDSDRKVSRMEVNSLKEVVARMTADASAIQCQLDATKIARDQARDESAGKSQVIERLEGEVADHLKTIAECKERTREDEMVRRRLHNTIQELKGNIRVFCRVRPFLPNEFDGCGRESICSNGSKGSGKGSKVNTPPAQLQISYPDKTFEEKKITLQYSSEQASTSKNYEFDFDRVFGPESRQEHVFEEISQLVQSVLDGYNVCIFAYGQTGSGKTFTMEGPEDPLPVTMDEGGVADQDRRGMISRAVEQVFSSAIESRETGWEYKMSASFLEIYNETLRDLLSSSGNSTAHDIKMDPDHPGQVYVTNLTPVAVTSKKQVESLLERASKNRAVAATNCNERSSRSHSVFMLKISGKNEKTGQNCEGTLNLIDLAGSERLSQSGSQGERLRETKNINKSLSNLGNVIMALANKDSHIPYRNSKLTYLLQNSLGGNSKTLMFVNMSPLAESLQETLCSLRFATKVNQCNIGTAKKTVK